MKRFICIISFLSMLSLATLYGQADARYTYIPGTQCYPFSQGVARILDERCAAYPPSQEREFYGKYGFIDRAGRLVIPLLYDRAEDFSQGLAVVGVWIDGSIKHGYINLDGEISIPLKFEAAGSFSEGLAPVQVNDKWGFIDNTGKFIIEPKYLGANSFSDGLAGVSLNDGTYAYINRKGKIVIPIPSAHYWSFSEGMAVGPDLKGTMMDHEGKICLTFDDDLQPVKSVSEGLITMRNRGALCGFANTSGNLVIPCIYETVFRFSEGLAAVSKNGKFGFIDKKGNLILPHIYNSAHPQNFEEIIFSEGLAAVEGGYINRRGEWVLKIVGNRE